MTWKMTPTSPILEPRKRKRSVEEPELRQVALVYDDTLVSESSKLPIVKKRGMILVELLKAYNLLNQVQVCTSQPATEEELYNFHSQDYVDYLKSINNKYTCDDEIDSEFGIGYDCPPMDGIFNYCCAMAGATLTAVRTLTREGGADVAVNWFGGWHHAKRFSADGFCYVNDVVLGILELRKTFDKILYIDLDVHHGDGVEASFEITTKVLTLSIHQFGPGFYPGTGKVEDVGDFSGKFYSVNVPLKEGVSDQKHSFVFDRVWEKVTNVFQFDAVVVQCGADGLTGDPMGSFNLTEKSYGHCLKKILDANKPTLVLGGGGYNIPNTVRCWTYLTSVIVNQALDNDIPENDYLLKFGPSYELAITPGNRKDENSEDYINEILEYVHKNLSNLELE